MRVSGLNARTGLRTLVGIAAALGLLAMLTMPALGASVTPVPIRDDNNPTCADFGDWTELKVEPPANGDFDDGVLFVAITNFTNSDPKGFDWESNIGVDAVLVKAGDDKHNLYVYDPEATSDEGLGPQDGAGNGISHISFCYDADGPTPTPGGGGGTPTPTPRGGQLGGNPTPTPDPVPDTAIPSVVQSPAIAMSLLFIGALGSLMTLRLARRR